MARFLLSAALLVGLAACGGGEEEGTETGSTDAPIRGLLTVEVGSTEETTRRRYPGVLEPKEITSLSFEVSGRLEELDLSVGQRVSEGQLLAQLDNTQFQVTIETRQASVDEADALLSQDVEDLQRQQTLLERGAGTQLAVDQANTDVRASRARLTQAERSLASAEEDLAETSLYAPFDGIVNSVDADSFATVAVGTTITSIYDATSYEVSFSVNFDTVAQLVVGTPALVRLADDPDVVLEAVVSELGERADTVSSFPVVVELKEPHPLIKAGMAVEVSLEFSLPAAQGFLIPMSAAILDGDIPDDAGQSPTTDLQMYVFDPGSNTVQRRDVTMGGIRENKLLIINGLETGERVAVAGVSFLRDGMEVKLIETDG